MIKRACWFLYSSRSHFLYSFNIAPQILPYFHILKKKSNIKSKLTHLTFLVKTLKLDSFYFVTLSKLLIGYTIFHIVTFIFFNIMVSLSLWVIGVTTFYFCELLPHNRVYILAWCWWGHKYMGRCRGRCRVIGRCKVRI